MVSCLALLRSSFLRFAVAMHVDDLLPPQAVVKKLAGDMTFLEGPVWIPGAQKVLFTDIPSSRVMEWSEVGGLKVFREGSNQSNGLTLDSKGRLVAFRHEGRDVVVAEADGQLTVLADRFDGKRFNSPNDGVFSSNGSMWFTDPAWGRLVFNGCNESCEDLPGNFVFRGDPGSNEVVPVLEDLCMPNGIAFSPDETYLYVSDTGLMSDTMGLPGGALNPNLPECQLPAGITAFEVTADRGLVRQWRTETFSDGLKVDAKGHIYTTSLEGITVLSPNGKIIGTLGVPESPANCAFGGPDFKTLFITARTSLYSVQLLNAGAKTEARSRPENSNLFFSLPSLALGGEVQSALRNFDGDFFNNFEVDFFGMKVFGGRDAIAEVTSLHDGIAELHVTKGGSQWTTKCMVDVVKGQKHLKQGETYTVKTTTTDIDCTTLDVKAAPYVDMSPFFTPTTEKYEIDGLETKCCCIGGRMENVCEVVPVQGYLSKLVQLMKKDLFTFWNPVSSSHFVWTKLLFKKKDGCGMIGGKGYHSHIRGMEGSKGWISSLTGRGQTLPNPKCRAKRSIFTLPFANYFTEDSEDASINKERADAVSSKAEDYISQVVKKQPARWYKLEIEYADRESFSKIAESWQESLKLDSNDRKRIDAAREVAVDQQVIDKSGVFLKGGDDPKALPEERFPLQLQVRFVTRADGQVEKEL